MLLFASACRSKPIARDPAPSAASSVTASVSTSAAVAPAPPPPPAPPIELSDDDVAAIVLRDYDRASHHVSTTANDAGLGPGEAIDVFASNGDVMHTFVDAEIGKGGVRVTRLRGEGWASADVLAWVVVGAQLGLCSVGNGFITLLEGKRAIAVARWEGSCSTPYRATFATAQGRGLVLEEEGGSGEDGVSEATNRVWVVSGARFEQAGDVRRSFQETWTHAIAGTTRKMDSTLAGDPSGVLVTEHWHFTTDSSGKTKDVTRTLRYTLRGDSLVVPTNPDPTP